MLPFPWEWPGQLEEAYQLMVEYLQQLLSFSISFDNLSAVQWLYGNSLGLAPVLAAIVIIFVLPLGLVVRKMRLSAAMSIIIAIAMPVIASVWFLGTSALQNIGDELSVLAVSISGAPLSEPLDDVFIPIPGVIALNAFLAMGMFLTLIMLTGMMLSVFFMYEVFNVVFVFIGLLLVAMYGLGPRTRKIFSIFVAFGVVSMLLGRPVALAVYEVGNAFAAIIPGVDNVFFLGLITSASMIVGLVLQGALIWGAYKGISDVVGRMHGRVRGSVSAYIKNERKTQSMVNGGSPTASQRAQRLANIGQRYGSSLGTEVRKAGAAAIATKAVIATGSKVHPAVAAGVAATSVVAKAAGNMQSKPPRERRRSLDEYR